MPGSADITLRVEADGTIRDASFGVALAAEDAEAWRGASWEDTVTEATRAKVRRLMSDAGTHGVSGFRQVNHTMPSGSEVPVEYSVVRVGADGSLVAVGRSLLVVSELQQRLVNAQQALERDHWRLREVETRYRLLFHRSPEAILVVDADTLRVVDANPAAEELLGVPSRRDGGVAASLDDLVSESERGRVRDHLRRTADTGRSTPLKVRVVDDGDPLEFRAALLSGDDRPLVLLHVGRPSGSGGEPVTGIDFGELFERIPDAMAVLDETGDVLWTNRRFVQLVQLRSVEEARGEPLARWLGRPGADLTILQTLVARHGSVNLFSTQMVGEFGATTEVEISAAPVGNGVPRMALLLRDVGRRLGDPRPHPAELAAALEGLSEQIGRASLKSMVSRTVELVERQLISDALELTQGNRTAAAELLGLSRQGLYTKLARYGLDAASGE